MKLKCIKDLESTNSNAIEPLFNGAILLNPLQVFFKAHVGTRLEDLQKPALSRGRFYLFDRRRPIYCIVDNQYRHFIPSFVLSRRFSYKRTTTTIPLKINPYSPNSFPGFVVVKTSQGYVAFIAYMQLFKKPKRTDVALDYVKLGKVQAFKPVYDKDGWLLKIKVLLENGRKFTLRRTGTPRKYPELKDGVFKHAEHSKQNEVYIDRLIRRIKQYYQTDRIEENQINYVSLYRSVLRTARRLVKSGPGDFETPVQVPAWLALAGLPPFSRFKVYSNASSFESLKWLLLVNLVVIARRQILKKRGENYALNYAGRVLGISSREIFEYFDVIVTPDQEDIRHLKAKELVRFLSIPECPFVLRLPEGKPSEAILFNYYEYCRAVPGSRDVRITTEATAHTLLMWISQAYAARELLAIEDVLRGLLSFPDYKIVAVDAVASQHPRCVNVLVWIRHKGPISISGYRLKGHAITYSRKKYQLVTGYVDHEKPLDYLLDFVYQYGSTSVIETNVHYLERRHKIIKRYIEDRNRDHHYTGVVVKEGNRRILKRMIAKNDSFPFVKHGAIFGKHFPFSIIAAAKALHNKYIFAFPIKPEFDSFNIIRVPDLADVDMPSGPVYNWYLANTSPVLRALLRLPSGELLFSKVCMGFLSEFHILGDVVRDKQLAQRHAYLIGRYLKHVALENDQGYCSPWQFEYSRSWSF